MKNKKTVMRVFTVIDWQKEQDYLRKMHKNGWKLIKVSGLCYYRFEKCDPEDVIYQLDYNAQGPADKGEYIQLFRDCGWEYIQDVCGYSYFRKLVSEMNGKEEEIFCDNESRLEMIRKMFRGRIIPLIPIFFGVIIPQMVGQFLRGGILPYILGWTFAVLFLLYLIVFIKFGYSFWKVRKAVRK